jgi:hypothetical protein
MSKASQPSLDDEEWVTIRDFTEGTQGYTLPKYEAKVVNGVDKKYLESELVLIKETGSISGKERMYQFPKAMFERLADGLIR